MARFAESPVDEARRGPFPFDDACVLPVPAGGSGPSTIGPEGSFAVRAAAPPIEPSEKFQHYLASSKG